MESQPSQQASLTKQATTTKDFLDQLKDFLTATLLDLQTSGKVPPIVNTDPPKKGHPPKKRKGSKSLQTSSGSDGEQQA
jgi:hypothetical protein